jgi:uncharacterized repeat protein (TIGR02543 family)
VLALAGCDTGDSGSGTTYYTVGFNSNGGSAVENQRVASGGKVTEPSGVTRTDYTLAGWYAAKDLSGTAWNFASDLVTSDLTLYAKWTQNIPDSIYYTVSFNANGADNAVSLNLEPQIILQGGKAANPGNAEKTGHMFSGWFNGEIQWNFDTDIVTGNITLTAKWDLIPLDGTVTIDNTSPKVTDILTADYSGGNESGTATWQWIRGESTVIADANSATYTVSIADVGYTLKARISYSGRSGFVTSEPTNTVIHNPDLKAVFGITETGTAGVTAAFNAVHDYLQSRNAEQVATDGVIALGDYIDLESLSIAGYPTYDDTNGRYGKLDNGQNTDLGEHGKLLRLIVVGINSFNARSDYYYYLGNDNGNSAHVVFQFQNLPVRNRCMNQMYYPDAANSYLKSEMRKYLVPTGTSGSGAFLAGLENAGVPLNVLWAPKRYVAEKGSGATKADLVEDLLWLPTEREMFSIYSAGYTDNGAHDAWGPWSNSIYETLENQAWLEYYTSDAQRRKYYSSSDHGSYWTASPKVDHPSYFTMVYSYGDCGYYNADFAAGCAPAFCVK